LQDRNAIGVRHLVGYGLASTPVIYAYVLVLIMYMKYASVELGISTALIGTIFFFAKAWDAVTDPVVGFLSDRTRSRAGRRRPWILASAPMLAAFCVMSWMPPTHLEGVRLTAWISVGVLGFYTAYTLFEVPHMALGAELSLDSRERNRIFGVRQSLKILGMVVAFAVGTAVVGRGIEATRTMVWILAASMIVLIPGGTLMLPPERVEFQGRAARNPLRAVADVWANRHARLLLLVVFIDAIGVGGIGTLTPFVVHYVVGREDLIPALLSSNMVASFLSIPIWIRLARRFEKRHLMLASMIGSALGYGAIVLVGHGDWHIILGSSLLAGVSSGCPNILGYTLKSEIIDFDEYRTGERKEGAYFAGWAFMSKLAAGIMMGLVGWSLAWVGFDGGTETQSEAVQRAMLLLMGGFPLVCYLVGAVLFSRFSLTEADHVRIRAELDARATHGA
jgi:GPH family glycoside/pentoside/hexuronide:cation symporter